MKSLRDGTLNNCPVARLKKPRCSYWYTLWDAKTYMTLRNQRGIVIRGVKGTLREARGYVVTVRVDLTSRACTYAVSTGAFIADAVSAYLHSLSARNCPQK